MRKIIELKNDWKFYYKEEAPVTVNLPHTWNNIDGQDGGNDYYRGTCAYECDFAKPEVSDDEIVYLQFHGVNASARVFVNGTEVVYHDGGYSTFRAEVTSLLQETNHLRVEVDNSVNEYVYPQRADFTFYGGIYREVEVLVVNKKHFDLDYYGGPGFKYSAKVEGADAVVNVVTYVPEDVNVKVILKDAEGNVVAEAKGKETNLEVKNAHLWDGVNDPYLYSLTCQIVEGDKVLDEVSCKAGIRYFRVDKKNGFFLNGKPYSLHGVSRHQDRRALGNALVYEHMKEDIEFIKEVGANTIRLAHYQHNQKFYDLCDEYGFVVWAEIPYISEHLPNERANKNTETQMIELVTQNYNHPCIVTWGLSNEITIKKRNNKDMIANHKKLNKMVKEMDPTRFTTLACYAVCSMTNPISKITDTVGWNLYLGWYVPFKWLNDVWMWGYNLFYKRIPLCYSEYGAEGMPNLHSSHPKRGDHTEEYQAVYHEYMLECFKRNPQLWGTYVWNMFDFAADARDQGGEPGMNHKGLVTFDRKTRKDSFYLYKCYWNAEPMIHIASKRYVNRTDKTTLVKVYSNQKEVELYNNGKLVKKLTGEHVFKFKVKLEKDNEIEVRAGGLIDKMTIHQVDHKDPSYKLQKGKSQNWV